MPSYAVHPFLPSAFHDDGALDPDGQAAAGSTRDAEVARHADGDAGAGMFDAFLELVPWLRLEAGSPGLRVRKEAWRQRGVLGSGRVRRSHPLGPATKAAVTRRLRQVGVDLPAPYPLS